MIEDTLKNLGIYNVATRIVDPKLETGEKLELIVELYWTAHSKGTSHAIEMQIDNLGEDA